MTPIFKINDKNTFKMESHVINYHSLTYYIIAISKALFTPIEQKYINGFYNIYRSCLMLRLNFKTLAK